MDNVEQMLSALVRGRFYGSVEIKYEAGKPVLLRKTETIKPTEQDYRENRGTRNERINR